MQNDSLEENPTLAEPNGHVPRQEDVRSAAGAEANHEDSLSRALDVLAELLGEREELRIEIVRGGLRAVLAVKPAAEAAPVPHMPIAGAAAGGKSQGGLMFSTIEATVLKHATYNWQTGAQLAQKTGQTPSSWFKAILSNLVERQWLDGGRNGYRRREGIDYAYFDQKPEGQS